MPYQIYKLTGSNFAVGAIGLVELLPLVVFGLYGGALADHVDRRRLLVLAGVAQALLTACLLANAALAQPGVWVIYVVGVAAGGRAVAAATEPRGADARAPCGTTRPSRPSALAARSACRSACWRPGARRPAGRHVGVGWCFAVDVAGLVVATLLFARLRPYPHRPERRRRAWRASWRA